jgi:tRNA pseudouridine55 synthase
MHHLRQGSGGQAETSVDGVLVVDKPVGPTSHDVVACARRTFGISRVGHTGTLDPNASGVLPLVLGRATRLAQLLSGREKAYLATVCFGRSTDTYDSTGRIVSDNGPVPAREQVEAALARFRGTFEQMPPAHSAKKIGSVPAYKRARAGTPVDLKPATVTVTALELLEMDESHARLRIECSAGFYVRSLAHDLGAALGTGAMLEALVRTRAGAFGLDASVDLAIVTPERRSEALAAVLPMEQLLPELPAVRLTAIGERHARHGQTLGPADLGERTPGASSDEPGNRAPAAQEPPTRLFTPAGHLLGLGRPGAVPGTLHPSVILG